MNFTPTAEKLIPDLSLREELVLLARCLWSEGYYDHLAGHITYNLGDGTLLCNPWLITWNELRPEQVIRIDLEGNLLEGDWPVPLGIPLHLQLHKMRHDVKWAHAQPPALRHGVGGHGRDPADLRPELGSGRRRAGRSSTSTTARSTTPTTRPPRGRGDERRRARFACRAWGFRARRFCARRAPAGRRARAALPARVACARRRVVGEVAAARRVTSARWPSRTVRASSASGRPWSARSSARTRRSSTDPPSSGRLQRRALREAWMARMRSAKPG